MSYLSRCPDFPLHVNGYFETITKCPDFGSVLIFKCPDYQDQISLQNPARHKAIGPSISSSIKVLHMKHVILLTI